MRRFDVLLALKRIIVAMEAELCALLVNELLSDAVELAVPKSVGRGVVLARQRLGEHTNNWRLRALANMVAGADHRRVTQIFMQALLIVHVLLTVYDSNNEC